MVAKVMHWLSSKELPGSYFMTFLLIFFLSDIIILGSLRFSEKWRILLLRKKETQIQNGHIAIFATVLCVV